MIVVTALELLTDEILESFAAAEAELAAAAEFDHVLVNADVEQCAEALIDSAGLSGHSESSPNGK